MITGRAVVGSVEEGPGRVSGQVRVGQARAAAGPGVVAALAVRVWL